MNHPIDISKVKVGAIVRAVSARVETTQSEPPLRYTEASLLDDMLHAARHAGSEADAAVLNATNGIGTARTRSESIVDLIRNKSLVRETDNCLINSKPGSRHVANVSLRKSTQVVKLTEAGRKLEAALPPELKNVGLTAKWEMLCRRIERGEITAEQFLSVVRKFVTAVVEDVRRRKKVVPGATTSEQVTQNQHTV